MQPKPRVYDSILRRHLADYRQMAFLSGPRQVGKTTLARSVATVFFAWDDPEDRLLLLRGGSSLADAAGLSTVADALPVVAFDEIHRHARWKSLLKGFFDKNENRCRIVATGSARMDVYKRGGDSLMGRYFPYRVHPFSVAELLDTGLPGSGIVRAPAPVSAADWNALLAFGGFPEPFSLRTPAFLRRWQSLRFEQLLRHDLRDLSRTTEIDRIDTLARLLALRSGSLLSCASLAREIAVSEPTVKQWIVLLRSLYYGFTVPPWHRNIENSLRKTPKWYLRDWSAIADAGSRHETFVACHLLKAVEGWSDLGLGDFALFYLRDTQKREVDFLVTRDGSPWFLAEVKSSDSAISKSLAHFQRLTGAPHAFQVVVERPFVSVDLFANPSPPVVVPARTFLSQLL